MHKLGYEWIYSNAQVVQIHNFASVQWSYYTSSLPINTGQRLISFPNSEAGAPLLGTASFSKTSLPIKGGFLIWAKL